MTKIKLKVTLPNAGKDVAKSVTFQMYWNVKWCYKSGRQLGSFFEKQNIIICW